MTALPSSTRTRVGESRENVLKINNLSRHSAFSGVPGMRANSRISDTTAKFRDHQHKTGQMARFVHLNTLCQGESRPPVAQALAAVFLR